ncbi:exported hypothetical protein [Rubrivivax sp. A210]|uniref:PEP-CTERM sorting domain-containing protein n=1 Tax=Rubrivivax sp. A210 TaxID=2772301 RepID=UPI001919CDCD|nr:PEP-CTERM sorting domain-containing protein [Rubrivivax sp. A210]CAD5372409.1 exported hypothetical protein [Rubrivivax sp. A210]
MKIARYRGLVAAALAAAALLSALPARAVDLLVMNPGFEADPAADGAFVVIAPAPTGWQAYDPSGMLASSPGLNALGVIRPRLGHDYFPGGSTEGVNAALVFLAGPEAGEAGLQQTLVATLAPATVYTLQVDVGNIASGVSLPGSSGGAGNFFDLDGFPGYRIELLAGGTVLAADSSSAGLIPEGEFRTATLSFDAASAAPALLGQALGLRLVNLKAPGTAEVPNIEVDFDHVRLQALPAPVPEPGSGLLLAGGLACWVIALGRRRIRR